MKSIDRRTFLKAAAAATTGLTLGNGISCASGQKNASRPNVLFIICDDLNHYVQGMIFTLALALIQKEIKSPGYAGTIQKCPGMAQNYGWQTSIIIQH